MNYTNRKNVLEINNLTSLNNDCLEKESRIRNQNSVSWTKQKTNNHSIKNLY